jgi:ABC-type branched-subunit amino acid transport system ATPase component
VLAYGLDSIAFEGIEITKLPPHTITQLGLARVPEGRSPSWRTLKRFHAWTEESVKATVARRDAALIRALQVDREESGAAG